MSKDYSVNRFCRQAEKERAIYFETIEEARGFIDTIDLSGDQMVVEKRSGRAYSGPDARKIVGLPDMTVRVKPDHNPDFDIFVQSTSTNRKLISGTRLLLLL